MRDAGRRTCRTASSADERRRLTLCLYGRERCDARSAVRPNADAGSSGCVSASWTRTRPSGNVSPFRSGFPQDAGTRSTGAITSPRLLTGNLPDRPTRNRPPVHGLRQGFAPRPTVSGRGTPTPLARKGGALATDCLCASDCLHGSRDCFSAIGRWIYAPPRCPSDTTPPLAAGCAASDSCGRLAFSCGSGCATELAPSLPWRESPAYVAAS